MEVHTLVSFISLEFVAVKLQMFKSFHGDAASIKHPFGGFLRPFSHKYRTSLLEFIPEILSLKRQRQYLKNLAKLSVKGETRRTQS